MSYRKKHIRSKINKSKPRKFFLKSKTFWFFLLVLIIFSFAVYLFLFFPRIQVKNIIIYGNEKTKTEDINNLISNSVNRKLFGLFDFKLFSKSIFLVNSKEMQNEILNSHPAIKSASVKKIFPESLSVQISERNKSAVFSQNNKYFFIDETGIIFEETQSVLAEDFIVRQNLDANYVVLGNTAVQKNVMETILKIEKNLKDNFKIDLAEALISTPTKLNITTKENWQIYFNIDQGSDIALQIAKLNLLLEQEISPEKRQTLEYIDLYFKNRAYYK